MATAIARPFGPRSQGMVCPFCSKTIITRVELEASSQTHLFAVLLCVFACIPCCLIPYCVNSCQIKNHYCPGCQAYLGTYSN